MDKYPNEDAAIIPIKTPIMILALIFPSTLYK